MNKGKVQSKLSNGFGHYEPYTLGHFVILGLH